MKRLIKLVDLVALVKAHPGLSLKSIAGLLGVTQTSAARVLVLAEREGLLRVRYGRFGEEWHPARPEEPACLNPMDSFLERVVSGMADTRRTEVWDRIREEALR